MGNLPRTLVANLVRTLVPAWDLEICPVCPAPSGGNLPEQLPKELPGNLPGRFGVHAHAPALVQGDDVLAVGRAGWLTCL